MPLIGSTVTNAARSAAISEISTVLDRAGHTAALYSDDALEAFSKRPWVLLETPSHVIDDLAKTLTDRLVWANEYNCFNRALVGAHELNSIMRQGMSPLDDAFHGAISINHQTYRVDSEFHAALAVKRQGAPGIEVLDLLAPSSGFIPLEEWAIANANRIVSPWSGTGITGRAPFVNREGFLYARDKLHESWNLAESHGVMIRG